MMSGNNLDTAVTGICVGLAETKLIAACEFTYMFKFRFDR